MSRTSMAILGVFALAVFALVLFSIQNSARSTQLSFNLGLIAWQLKEPVPVIGLLWGSFGLGALISAALLFFRGGRLKKRIRELEQQVALGDGGSWR